MDFIDNILYASYLSPLQQSINVAPPPAVPPPQGAPVARIISDYVGAFGVNPPPTLPVVTAGSFSHAEKMNFCAYRDHKLIEDAIRRHWYDVDDQVNYDTQGVALHSGAIRGTRLISFEETSNYHLIMAYLLENTRIVQIFEGLIQKYYRDEEFGIPSNPLVTNWMYNSEQLFFNGDNLASSSLRPGAEAVRRNAYWRMFGIDLAFGSSNPENNGSTYHKASASNQQFIPLFERFLTEVWMSFINARNTSGENRTDLNIITDLALQLRELLIARRGDVIATTYANQNLAREEFMSSLITTWFTFIVSDNTPVVQFLNCQSSTIGERLLKIGQKVGIPAHTKCQSLFEMAAAANTILIAIEANGIFNVATTVQNILSSLNPSSPGSPADVSMMEDLLTIINNWEKATGHRIKNPEANITGAVRVQQNGITKNGTQPAMN